MIQLEQLNNAAIQRSREENDKLANKIFVLENIINKKDNLIDGYIKKLAKLSRQTFYNNIDDANLNNEKEIYIIDPSIAVTQINDELQMYKRIYLNLSTQIKEMRVSIGKLKKTNTDLENEVMKLKQELKLANVTVRQQYDQSMNLHPNTIIQLGNKNQLKTEDNSEYIKTDNSNFTKSKNLVPAAAILKSHKSDNNILRASNVNNPNLSNNSQLNLQILKQYETYEENNRNRKERADIADEWVETLKHCGMTQDEFIRLSKNKLNTKLIDALEYLYKLITDKNTQIRILTTENESLNLKNLTLNKENMLLCEQNTLIMQEKERKVECERCDKTRAHISKGDTGMDSSMVNNTSRATVKENDDFNLVKHLNNNYNHRKNPYQTNNTNNTNNSNTNQHKTNINYYTNTLESITSSDFRDGIFINDGSFISETNTEAEVHNIITVDQIKNTN